MTPEDIKKAKSAHWGGMLRGIGRQAGLERRKAYSADHAALVAEGKSGDEAFLILAGPGGKYELLAPSPAPSEQAAFSPVKEHEDRKAETRRQAAFKLALCERAGSNPDYKGMLVWAGNWQPKIMRDGVIHWDQVTDDPPCSMAVAFLEQACLHPGDFIKDAQKSLGKGSELGDDMLQKERKREAELLRLLDEVDAELAADA